MADSVTTVPTAAMATIITPPVELFEELSPACSAMDAEDPRLGEVLATYTEASKKPPQLEDQLVDDGNAMKPHYLRLSSPSQVKPHVPVPWRSTVLTAA